MDKNKRKQINKTKGFKNDIGIFQTIESQTISMGLFRKKQRAPDETMETTFQEEETKKGNTSRLGKWVCGSRASKEAIAEDNKISPKNSSYSTSSSSQEDKRDDKQGLAATRSSKYSSSRQQMAMTEMDNSLVASLPPPAAEAAFQGRPRFDWIDVVGFLLHFFFFLSIASFLTLFADTHALLLPLGFFPGIPRRHPDTDDLSQTLGLEGNGRGRTYHLVHSQPKTPAQGQLFQAGQRYRTQPGLWLLLDDAFWERRL